MERQNPIDVQKYIGSKHDYVLRIVPTKWDSYLADRRLAELKPSSATKSSIIKPK